jgi:hypothetical protein
MDVGAWALVGVTVLLAIANFLLVKQGKAANRAQWRPVLLVRELVPVPSSIGKIPGTRYQHSTLTVSVENVGRGPAFDATGTAQISETGEGRLRLARPLELARAAGDLVEFEWMDFAPAPDQIDGSFDYGDMSDRIYSTRFAVSPKGELIWQGVIEHGPALTWWQRSRIVPTGARKLLTRWWLNRLTRKVQASKGSG